MPTFRVTGPDGASYKIEAPDEAQAMSAFQQMSGGSGGASPKGDASKWSGSNEAINSATFGVAIPAVAAAVTPLEMIRSRTLDPVEAYRTARNNMDANRAAWQDQNPVSNVASNVAGGLATGGILSKGGMTLAGRLGAGPAARVGEAALEGGAFGALQGAGEARGDVGEHLRNIAVGGGVGLAAGGVLGAGAQALGAAGDGVMSAFQGRKDPVGYAARQVAKAAEADNTSASKIAHDLFNAPPGTTVADVAGENTRDLLRTVNNVRGAGRTDVADMVSDRMAGQRERLMDSVSKNLASPEALSKKLGKKIADGDLFNATLDDIVQTYRTGADPLYKRAYAKPVNYDDFSLDKLMPRIPRQAWREAQDLMNIEGYTPKQAIASIADDGSVTINKVPDLKQWDYLKRGLDTLINNEDGKGAIGTVSAKGRALENLKKELTDILDKQNPSYKAARQFSSDQIGLKKALENGPKVLNMAPEDAARYVAKLPKAERDVTRIGVARALRDKVLSGTDGSDRVKAVWTPKTRAIIDKVFDKDSAQGLARAMDYELKKMETVRAAAGNSTTARQLLAANETGFDPEIALKIGTGNFGAALSAIGRYAKKMGGLNDKSASAMADILLAGPKGKQIPVDVVEEAQRRLVAARNKGIALNPIAPRSIGLLSGSVFASPRDQ